MGRGSRTKPPTRTGSAGAMTCGGGGGGGGGGGATAGVTLALAAKIPPRTPATAPTGMPPGTPPIIPVTDGAGWSIIFAISFGITVGMITASGDTLLICIFTTRGAAAAGGCDGGGGGGGGGAMGDSSVIKSSRSESVWGISNGTTSTAAIRNPCNMTDPTTEGFLYLSLSGKVAGRSLKITVSDILNLSIFI